MIMKRLYAALAASLLAFCGLANPASAAIFSWSFTDTYFGSGDTISGTVDLFEGFNDGASVQPTVVASGDPLTLGSGWNPGGGLGFTVTNGVVTQSDYAFYRGNQTLYFGSSPKQTFYPELNNRDTGYDVASYSGTVFSAAAAPGAPAPLLGLGLFPALAVLIGLVVTRLRRHLRLPPVFA